MMMVFSSELSAVVSVGWGSLLYLLQQYRARVCWRPPRGFAVVGVGVGAGMGVQQVRGVALASELASVMVMVLAVMMVVAASVK